MVEYPKIWTTFTDEKLIREFNLLLGPLLFLAFEIIGYLIILIIIEFFTYSNIFGNSTNNIILDEQKNNKHSLYTLFHFQLFFECLLRIYGRQEHRYSLVQL